MKEKVVSFVLVFLLSAVLLLVSCGTGSTPATMSSPVATTTISAQTPKTTAPPASPEAESPQYGGTLTLVGGDPQGFDEAHTFHMMLSTAYFTNEELIMGDWMKGPAGTGETTWLQGFVGRMDLETGCLAESWDLPDATTLVFHLRQGVKWQNIPPVSGRELVAADVAWSLERAFSTPSAYLFLTYPPTSGYAPKSFKALDKYTVEAKVPAAMQGLMLMACGDFVRIYPPEMVAKYGSMKDWRNACGTGPFLLTDYVPGSSISYTRNPNYWQHDPARPENRLPYVDGVKELIISDASTQLAAFRTGKIDAMYMLESEDARTITDRIPEMQSVNKISPPWVIFGREDKPELPFRDVKVRQAMNMAIDRQSIVDEYYEGHAELFGFPWPDTEEYKPFFTPLDQQPQVVQDLFTYDPGKAKQFLAEAGYPTGFKTQVVCATGGTQADFLSIIRQQLLAVGVDMEIKQVEGIVYMSVLRGRTQPEMIYEETKNYGFPFRLLDCRIESSDNPAYFESERTRRAYEAISAAVGKDDAELARLLKDIGPFMLEQSYGIWLPAAYKYNLWWPWLRNYHGEATLGYFNTRQYAFYLWIDRSLKKSMGF